LENKTNEYFPNVDLTGNPRETAISYDMIVFQSIADRAKLQKNLKTKITIWNWEYDF